MKQIKARIISNKKINFQHYKMVMNTSGLKEPVKAGQFVNVRVSETTEPLLRKPLSVYRVCKKPPSLEVFYKVVGEGTRVLSRKVKGESLDIIAPLGNGYELPDKLLPVMLVGGGTGTVSLFFLAETLIKSGFSDVKVLIGAKDKENVICEKDFLRLGCKVEIATEDGCKGFKGCVSDLFKSLVSNSSVSTAVYACGPKPMLREMVKISEKFNLPCRVSLEEYIGCGVGACMSCVVKAKTLPGNSKVQFVYKSVCKDGPVFDGSEIIWE